MPFWLLVTIPDRAPGLPGGHPSLPNSGRVRNSDDPFGTPDFSFPTVWLPLARSISPSPQWH